MIYKEVEQLAQTPEGLQQILEDLTEEFEEIEFFASELKTAEMDGEELSKIMTKSTGIWDNLIIVFTVLDTYKTKKEGEYYSQRKMEIEARNEKFTDASLTKEASAHVNPERRVRNIVEAYMSAVDKNIIMAQSKLKYLMEGKKRVGNQEG